MSEHVELEKCPFCGGDAEILVGYHAFFDAKIKCEKCDAEGPLFGADDFKGDEATHWIDCARRHWNTRKANP